MRHLPAAEHDRHLDPRALFQEPDDVPLLDPVVVRVDLGAHLHLLDLDPRLLLPGLLLADVPLVLDLAVIHDPADGRVRLGRHFHEVQVQVLGTPQGVLDRDDPDLRAVRPHEPDLGCPNPVIHTCFKRDPASPPDEEERQRRRSKKEQPGVHVLHSPHEV